MQASDVFLSLVIVLLFCKPTLPEMSQTKPEEAVSLSHRAPKAKKETEQGDKQRCGIGKVPICAGARADCLSAKR